MKNFYFQIQLKSSKSFQYTENQINFNQQSISSSRNEVSSKMDLAAGCLGTLGSYGCFACAGGCAGTFACIGTAGSFGCEGVN